jgi:hypothetical protein
MESVLPCALLLLLGRLNAQALVFEEFTYTVTNNSITITEVDCFKAKSVLDIPAVIAGLPVTTIAARGPRILEGGAGSSGFLACSSVTRVTIPNCVTNIGVGAFSSSQGLTAINVDASNPAYSSEDGVLFDKDRSTLLQYPRGRFGDYTLPDSVTLVGASAFEEAYGLTGVTLPDRLTTIGEGGFYSCNRLTGVTIGDRVTSIGKEAFTHSSLTSVYLPHGVTHLGEGVFSYCASLTDIGVDAANPAYSSLEGVLFNKEQSILLQFPLGRADDYTIPNSVTALGFAAFQYSQMTGLTIPDSFTTIPSNSFASCGKLVTVRIPSSVKSIGNKAFRDCNQLTSVAIPDSVTSIGDNAFHFCGLTSVSLPDGLISIGDAAYDQCRQLTNVTLPSSVTSIGARAFGGCFRLKAIEVDTSNPAYSSLEGVLFNKARSTLIQHPINRSGAYTIPDSVTAIGDGAFGGCEGLTSVTIPDGVTTLGEGAFGGCNGLRNIALPNSLASIGDWALAQCQGLTSVNIPDGVTSLGDGALAGCPRLTTITLPSSITRIGDYAFNGGTLRLTGVYFRGNAPGAGPESQIFNDRTKVYFLPGTAGWGATFAGASTIPWFLPNPLILTRSAGPVPGNNPFQFTMSWATNATLVVEACTDLAHPVWAPVGTNTLIGGSAHFSDSQSADAPARYYRLRGE